MISALGSPEGKAEGIGIYNYSNITSLEPTVGDYSLFPIKLQGLKRLTTWKYFAIIFKEFVTFPWMKIFNNYLVSLIFVFQLTLDRSTHWNSFFNMKVQLKKGTLIMISLFQGALLFWTARLSRSKDVGKVEVKTQHPWDTTFGISLDTM